tara:strand:+ start:340 stop:828 length:489 start_codon:yes stop_codon:yes gene_type:complete
MKQRLNMIKPILHLLAGAAGSGKSYVRENILNLTCQVIDADEFKKQHPDYDPKNPSLVHEWSNIQAARAFNKALAKGETFIYDGTGTKTEKYLTMIEAAHTAGFEVSLTYVKVKLETSLKRNAERVRTVPEMIVREQHNALRYSIPTLSNSVDKFQIIENDS